MDLVARTPLPVPSCLARVRRRRLDKMVPATRVRACCGMARVFVFNQRELQEVLANDHY